MMDGMVERRMRSAIISTGSLWFTAWVNAGQPDLSKILTKKPSEEMLKEIAAEDEKFNNSNIKGRSCD
jgi:hypothetical protein